MIQHYTPLLTSIKTMFGLKSSSFWGASIFSAISIETMSTFIVKEDFMEVPIVLLLVVSGFILLDWLFGSAASRKLHKEALNRKTEYEEAHDTKAAKDAKCLAEKYKIKSIKISHTIFKFLALYLWLALSLSIVSYTNHTPSLRPFVEGLTIIPILLFGFREFVSIGEGIETLYGEKPYLFEIGEQIFDILQIKFFKKLDK